MVDGLSRRGGRKAVWRSSQHHFEDAAVFCPAGLSAARASGFKEAWPVHCVDRHASSMAMALEGLRRPLAGKMVQGLWGSGEGVFAAGESPNALYGHSGGGGAGGQVPDCCGLGRALHRRWRYQRSAPAQARKALCAGLGRVCVYRWARARSRLDMAVRGSTRDTQAIPPPTGRMSTQNRMAFCIFISDSYVIF
jgi:hypothetical protein